MEELVEVAAVRLGDLINRFALADEVLFVVGVKYDNRFQQVCADSLVYQPVIIEECE